MILWGLNSDDTIIFAILSNLFTRDRLEGRIRSPWSLLNNIRSITDIDVKLDTPLCA